ncbi:unnamed protein product [Nippostrongylus brasiliensis]|uniref:Protein kinase domain-containing protein n=1 Tax=Nippostrongylus brasiliensis TaxID=27835 RepID=A0A0N4YV25_NIPBR|nr:unnamed protein product [Nippostrongylus brasiliensis]
MKWSIFTASALILILSFKDQLIRFLCLVEDRFLPLGSFLNCSSHKTNETLASGWTKLVHALSADTVLKQPNLAGKTFQNCFHVNFGKNNWETHCRLELLRSFAKEIRALIALRRAPGVINIFSYCIPHDPLTNIQEVRIVTERGEPLDVLTLVQMSLQERHRLLNNIVRFFENYPSLRLHDIRRQQLVLVEGHPKIVDFDSAYFDEDETDNSEYHSTVIRKLYSELLMDHATDDRL